MAYVHTRQTTRASVVSFFSAPKELRAEIESPRWLAACKDEDTCGASGYPLGVWEWGNP